MSPMADLRDLDYGGPLARVLDRRELDRLDERVRRTISGHRSYALRYRPELSVESENAGGLSLAWITNLEVAPGRLADWQAFMQQRLPQFRGDNVVFGVYERYLGSGAALWQVVENHASFTELNRPTIMQRALGERTSTHRGRTRRRGPLGGTHRVAVRRGAELLGSRSPGRRPVPVGDRGDPAAPAPLPRCAPGGARPRGS